MLQDFKLISPLATVLNPAAVGGDMDCCSPLLDAVFIIIFSMAFLVCISNVEHFAMKTYLKMPVMITLTIHKL
jgi:hypothetical protein